MDEQVDECCAVGPWEEEEDHSCQAILATEAYEGLSARPVQEDPVGRGSCLPHKLQEVSGRSVDMIL